MRNERFLIRERPPQMRNWSFLIRGSQTPMRNEQFLIGESSLLMRSWLFLIRGSQTPTRNELLLLVGSAFQIRNSLPYGAIRVTIKRFNKEAMATSSGFFGSHAWAIQANEQPLCREVNASEAA